MTVHEMAARAWFGLCLVLGRMLRGARYSAPPVVYGDGTRVRKHRRAYAPFLVWLSQPLVRMLDTGVKVLPQREWEARERHIYKSLYGLSVEVDAGGALLLPRLPGQTLARLLDDPQLDQPARKRAMESAVFALAQFHAHGFTHGDAMAENVLVDLDLGAAQWFDFETVHDAHRSPIWKRADDLRALVVTCLIRTGAEQRADTVEFMLAVYADRDATRTMASNFDSVWRRSLPFHLAQAPMSFEWFREIGRICRTAYP